MRKKLPRHYKRRSPDVVKFICFNLKITLLRFKIMRQVSKRQYLAISVCATIAKNLQPSVRLAEKLNIKRPSNVCLKFYHRNKSAFWIAINRKRKIGKTTKNRQNKTTQYISCRFVFMIRGKIMSNFCCIKCYQLLITL